MDGAKGNGANAQEYDFKRWFNTIQENEGINSRIRCRLYAIWGRSIYNGSLDWK